MSKLSPTGQSMAALFSPEGEKLRAAQKEKARAQGANGQSFRIPGTQALKEGQKSGDSLGNPASPGYEPLHLKKNETPPGEGVPATIGHAEGFAAPHMGPQFVRLGSGWEKLLMAQKKICEKAKDLFTMLDAPARYHGQRKSSFLQSKSRGSILNVSTAEVAQAQAQAELDKKKTEEAA